MNSISKARQLSFRAEREISLARTEISRSARKDNPFRNDKYSFPLALFLFLFGIFLFTASGHTYSPDEETILYVAQAFVTRGEFNIPNRKDAPVVGGQRGVEGKIFAGTGVFTSLLVSPFYVGAEAVARVIEPRAQSFILRVIVVSLFNALIGALGGVVFFAWQRRMGIAPRMAVGVTLIAALGTMFWVYTRTLYAETLLALGWLVAVYAVRAFFDYRARWWLIVAGLAVGLSVLTKLQGALILPALLVYFAAQERRELLRHPKFLQNQFFNALAFIIPFAVCLVVLGYYNFIRFGSFLDTGYGSVDADYPIWRGVLGQVLSSGKSVFMYAPPLVLSVIAFPRFFKTYRAEAILCALLIATVIVFHARVYYWAGDGAWGPRYLAATMMFWILPLAVWGKNFLERALVFLFFALGVLVNLLGMSVNFDTYIQIEPREVVRHFEPSASPLLAQWSLLQERAGAWGNAFQARDGIFLTRGFVKQDELFPQYIPQRAHVWIKNADTAELKLYALDYRVETRPKRTLEFFANGAPLETTRVPHSDAGELEYRVLLPRASDVTLEIFTRGSDENGSSPQGDELGVHVQSIESTRGENGIEPDATLAIPNAPFADARELWGWFFRQNYLHWDHVAWYVSVAGLEMRSVMIILGAWFFLAAVSTTVGAIGLWRAR